MVVTDASFVDRETTVMAFGGSSPPRPPAAVLISILKCVRGHSLINPDDYFISDTGTRKTCRICRLTYLEQWAAYVEANREVEGQRIAAERAKRALERQERL